MVSLMGLGQWLGWSGWIGREQAGGGDLAGGGHQAAGECSHQVISGEDAAMSGWEGAGYGQGDKVTDLSVVDKNVHVSLPLQPCGLAVSVSHSVSHRAEAPP